MPTNTRTLQEMQAEMEQDAAGSWVRVALWLHKVSENSTRYFVVKSRTVIREYSVDWESGKPTVWDVPAEYSNVGLTITASELKSSGYRRLPGSRMFNEVTRELATL